MDRINKSIHPGLREAEIIKEAEITKRVILRRAEILKLVILREAEDLLLLSSKPPQTHVISTGGGAFAAVVERTLYFAFAGKPGVPSFVSFIAKGETHHITPTEAAKRSCISRVHAASLSATPNFSRRLYLYATYGSD